MDSHQQIVDQLQRMGQFKKIKIFRIYLETLVIVQIVKITLTTTKVIIKMGKNCR